MGDYVSLAEVRRYQDLTAVKDDTLLETMIMQAEKWFEDATQTVFDAAADSTVTFDAKDEVDGPELFFRGWLAATPTTVTNGDSTTLSSAQYVLQPTSGPPYSSIKIRSDQSVFWTYSTYHEGAISILGRWGYTTSAPQDVKYAVARLVKHWYHARDNSSDVDRPLLAGEGTVLMPTTIPNDVQLIIKNYRPFAAWGK